MSIVEQAFKELYPEKEITRRLILRYNGKFRGYNANIRMNSYELTIAMSKKWKTISPDIQKGLIQELMVRLFKEKKQTMQMDLYHNFIRSLPRVAPKTERHPILEESFERVNDMFFAGIMEQPNLRIGNGVNRLGTYEYATDTVTISKTLLENEELMDYVMYHELLHKKHQYIAKEGRTAHHSRKFRLDEKKFPNAELLEKELQKLVRKNKKFSWFW